MEILNIISGAGTLVLFVGTVCAPIIMKDEWVRNSMKIILSVILLGTVIGSLLYSNLFGLAPCVLCWYQRIFLFPLPIILFISYIRNINPIWPVVGTLSAIGLCISVYHVYLQFVSTSNSVVCGVDGIACNVPYITVFGFISIPVMATAIFLFTTVIAYLQRGR